MLEAMLMGSSKGIPGRDISIDQLDNFFGSLMVKISVPECNSLDT